MLWRVLSTEFMPSLYNNSGIHLDGMRLPPICIPDDASVAKDRMSMFHLARFLKAMLEKPTKTRLRSLFEEWLSLVDEGAWSDDFEENWIEFLTMWYRVKVPYGQALSDALALNVIVPDWMKEHHLGATGDKIVEICCALAVYHAPKPFYLSGRKAGELADIDHQLAAKTLHLLVLDEFLELVSKGTLAGRKASEYRIGSPPNAMV